MSHGLDGQLDLNPWLLALGCHMRGSQPLATRGVLSVLKCSSGALLASREALNHPVAGHLLRDAEGLLELNTTHTFQTRKKESPSTEPFIRSSFYSIILICRWKLPCLVLIKQHLDKSSAYIVKVMAEEIQTQHSESSTGQASTKLGWGALIHAWDVFVGHFPHRLRDIVGGFGTSVPLPHHVVLSWLVYGSSNSPAGLIVGGTGLGFNFLSVCDAFGTSMTLSSVCTCFGSYSVRSSANCLARIGRSAEWREIPQPSWLERGGILLEL